MARGPFVDPVARVAPEPERLWVPDGPGCLYPSGGLAAWWHRPSTLGARSRGGLVILPIQGGDYDISRHFAEAFSRAGYHALRFERRAQWLQADRPLDVMTRQVQQYVQDIHDGIELWLARGEVDPERVGLFGVSMGAVMGTRVSASSARVKASVLCIGGGPLPDVLMTADDQEINQYRADISKALGVSGPALRAHLAAALPDDPIDAAPGLDPARTLFIGARFDRVVRWRYHRALWQAAGCPPRIILPTGHYSAIVFVPLIRWRSLVFFDRHLLG